MTPEAIGNLSASRAAHVRAGGGGGGGGGGGFEVEVENTLTPTPPTSTGDVGGGGVELFEALRIRGVAESTARSLVAAFPGDRIEKAVAYFDATKDAGPGLLVNAIREGRARKRSQLDVQLEYGERICGWLNAQFPELVQPSGAPHPAAVAAVIRLHFEHGRGALTKAAHGPAIRAAVRAFDERYGTTDLQPRGRLAAASQPSLED